MKKILFLAMAAAALVSCSQNEEFENAGQKAEIKFGTLVSSTTRAAITNLDKLKEVGFTVYAYNTGAKSMAGVSAISDINSFIPEKKVTYATESDSWNIEGGDTYYWPLTDNIQFFAYANGTATYNAPAAPSFYPTIDFTVVADNQNQTDFVVAQATDKTKDNASSGITLAFTHALTQVNFSVKGADENTYKITSITLKSVANQGRYDFKSETWTNVTGTADYTYNLIDNPTVQGTTPKEIGAANSALMLMPQAMPDAEGTSSIEVVYQVFNGADQPLTNAITSKIDLKGTTTAWQVGKKIRYVLELSNQGAKMKFVPEVGDWTTEQSPEQEENAKPTPAV